VAAQAEVIVTTDRDLLDDDRLKAQLLERWKMRVVEPAEFLAMV
jgi:predicted nucleic acid-binding protein